jgi:hypothetical protein
MHPRGGVQYQSAIATPFIRLLRILRPDRRLSPICVPNTNARTCCIASSEMLSTAVLAGLVLNVLQATCARCVDCGNTASLNDAAKAGSIAVAGEA